MQTSLHKPRFGLFIGIALMVMNGLMLANLIWKDVRLAVFGKHATAEVIKINESTSTERVRKRDSSGRLRDTDETRTSTSHRMELAFKTEDGQPILFETLATFNTVTKVGEKHPVVYMASDPMRAEINSAKQLWLLMLIGFTFSVLFLGGGYLLTRFSSLRPA